MADGHRGSNGPSGPRPYREMLDATSDAIFLHDAETGQILDVNQTMLDMYGCTREELMHLKPEDLTASEGALSAEQAIRLIREAAKGTPQRFEWEARRRNGDTFWVEVILRRLEIDGQVRVLASARDITSRRTAETARCRAEELYRLIAENATDMISVHDRDGIYLYASPFTQKLLGYAPEELKGRSAFDFIHPDDRSATEDHRSGTVAGASMSTIRYRLVHKNGTAVWVETNSRALPDAKDEGPNRILAVTRDIRERVFAEEEQSRFFALSTALFMIADTDGTIRRVNPAWEKALGYTPEEMEGRPYLDFVHPDDIEKTTGEGRSCAQGIETRTFSNRYRHKDGSYRILSWTSNPIPDKGLIYALTIDITEHRRLEQRVRQIEKMGAIGQLAGGVAHDFNNQLAAIQGYTELLQERIDDPVLKRYVESVLVASRRSADLTRQLLAFARKGQYQSLVVDLHDIIHEVVEVLERSIDKRVHIKQHLDASPAAVRGDPSQLQNALLNLALNARDAMPSGGDLTFTTDIRTMSEQDCRNLPYEINPGPYLQILVKDTGIGMDCEVQQHLFEPFFTTKKQGTGMGLAAVYGTVKNHRGAINVCSQTGKGTSIEILLPLCEAAATGEEADASHEPAQRIARVLLVDDEQMVREMAAEMLRALGHQVATCSDGVEAVEYYREHWKQTDLVILDMVMPGRSGHDTFLDMRRVNPGIKALLSSGYSLDSEAQKILNQGVLGFVQKPYSMKQLSAKVSDALTPSEAT